MDIKELVKKASAEKEHKARGKHDEIMPIVDELRRKNFTWKAISEWLKENADYEVNLNTAAGAYARYLKNKDR